MTYSTHIRNDLREYGVIHVAKDISLRSINRVMFLKVLRCLKLEAVNPEYLVPPEGYCGMILDPTRLREYAKAPEYELSNSFMDQAFAKGDQCYGFFHGDVLAAYQWFSTKPTESGWHDLVVSFADRFVYMYKAFTHPDHRGRRLYPVGVTTMAAWYSTRGYRGVLSLTASNNLAALKSCYRMGFADCGRLYAAALRNHYFLHADSACKAYGFRLTRARSSLLRKNTVVESAPDRTV